MDDLAASRVAFPQVGHGGVVHAELAALRISPRDLLDVSVNVNPHGPCAEVRAAIAGADLQQYPDPEAGPARRALATWLDVDPARVVVGNGAVDLLWTLARAYVRRGDAVLVVEPAFSEMRSAAERGGARVEALVTKEEDDFALDVAALDDALARTRPRLAYVCTPSNPAGHFTAPGLLAALAEKHRETLFVADISFLSLSTHHAERAWQASERVVWLKSLTKDHGLAGLRIGCAVAPPSVARRIEEERPPWSVNALAQVAASAITSAQASAFVARSRASLLDDRARLEASLRALGLRAHPSDTVFVLASLGRTRSGASVRDKLLRDHHVLVRDCASFGLPYHLRIAARPARDQDRFMTALAQVLAG